MFQEAATQKIVFVIFLPMEAIKNLKKLKIQFGQEVKQSSKSSNLAVILTLMKQLKK